MSDDNPFANPKRADLHCHSEASNKAAEVVLNAISCPECYSRAEEVHAQAKRRGMDFVTLTDHDSIQGALRLADRADVLVGEELTCWFPEDRCKMHVLVWGLDAETHAALQKISKNIYEVAAYIERMNLAHAVAHPIYRQNDKLERWHLERLLLLFKGFECLNGAHSALHREAFEPLLDRLDEAELRKLSAKHGLAPRWESPWIKSRTAGSDDHGLLNIGRTWTEFPSDTKTVADVLTCLKTGRTRPGGEAGSSAKLAHTFYSVAVRYYGRHLLAPAGTGNTATTLLQMLVGERSKPTRRAIAGMVVKSKWRKLKRRLAAPFAAPGDGGTSVLRTLFLGSFRKRLGERPGLRAALDKGLPPLGEHDEMMQLAMDINRDVTEGLAGAFGAAIDNAKFNGLFDAISAVLAQQFVLAPYYFAVFHQNKERHLLRPITGTTRKIDASTLRVGLFTDTLDDINGVGRFIRDMGAQAERGGRNLTIHTCSTHPRFELPNRKNFSPLLAREMPYYKDLTLTIPPILEVLEWADRKQFDAVHLSTPGPMGLCGWLVARMLRVPVLGTYHTDFPKYVEHLTRDHRMVRGTVGYMKWFYSHMAAVFSRSAEYRFSLGDLGVAEERILGIQPGVDTSKFNPSKADGGIWSRHGVREPRRLLYCGRVSVEKNLPMLVEVFHKLRTRRQDVALVMVGDGPYLAEMKQALTGTPAYFLGYRDDAELAPLYAGSDLLAFPSTTDTLGQVVLEAQACGLPVLVSDEGGPQGQMENEVTGLVLPGRDASKWVNAIDRLFNDEALRAGMGRSAAARLQRRDLGKTFEAFWAEHVKLVAPAEAEALAEAPTPWMGE